MALRATLALAACAVLCGCPSFPDPLLREAGAGEDGTDIVRVEGGQDVPPDVRPDVIALDAVDAVDVVADAPVDARPDEGPDAPADVAVEDVGPDVVCASSSETVCGASCFDLQTTRAHCGRCDNNCGPASMVRMDGCTVMNMCSGGSCLGSVACP